MVYTFFMPPISGYGLGCGQADSPAMQMVTSFPSVNFCGWNVPHKPGRSCTITPGCPGIVRGDRCSVCGPRRQSQQEYDQRRGSASSRGYGRRWRRLRAMILVQSPLCVMCLAENRTTAAVEVDHITPLRDGGDNTIENLQPLCKSHHSQKTARDVRRRHQGKVTVPVTIVTGPPGAGKTTYVHMHRQWGDLVIDVDGLYAALSGLPWYEKPDVLLPFVLEARDAVLDRLHRQSELRHAWIITSEANQAELERMKARYNATVLVLEVGVSECLKRIANDPRRHNAKIEEWQPIVEKWWDRYNGIG